MILNNWRPEVTCVCIINQQEPSIWVLPLHTKYANGGIWVADPECITRNGFVYEDEIVAVLKVKRVDISNLNYR